MPQTTSEAPRYVIQSAASTLEVLLAFGRPPHRFTPSELAQELGIERNQAFRCLRTLFHVGFLHTDEDDRYYLTALVEQLAGAAQPQPSLVAAAKSFMDEVSQTTEETVNLFVLEGDEATCVDHRDGLRPVRLVTELGRRAPLHAGACPKAILAFLPPERQQAVVERVGSLPQLTPHTLNSSEALQRELQAIRTRGYAISDLDVDLEARGVGAPIFTADGNVVGAISVGGPASRMTPGRIAELGEVIVGVARLISRHLGYNGAAFSPLP
ncbi:IclR family transcriptional regulator (plasmid) [Deinococcus metallilatus]|uniref:IclR family acetate operon transcriptional repressor n=1 Tax=Deinococcus metallilatus TaxID=1211322 RepID=A0AAJ5F603_9DEIO|nr:IclR family transcriptional regulator [Deinococcus metallilatus]MBB5293479.1 IclR family acetate operon transcriptional repressor [Deinococcus metallilatus]QBY06562.1 IclR family transcriptional regulator [Deinococcus metallilatus]RXJ17905.1 IclR family transcriptional regulator [Deinococcus metallilatus]TLK32177.1 IclR family transcriptional regulator [Deinococcus metallilatus]GMA15301.1 IclR family transcriptional regulator [Deinococcus metallilatus]